MIVKTCPFCGNFPFIKSAIFGYEKHRRYTIHCEICGFNLGMSDSEEEAIKRWNTRAEVSDDKVQAK